MVAVSSVFVGTRVTEVQELTDPHARRHVDFSDNPSDDITRGKSLAVLARPSGWNQGPFFFHGPPEQWPTIPKPETNKDSAELKKIALCGVYNRPILACQMSHSLPPGQWTPHGAAAADAAPYADHQEVAAFLL